MKRNHCFLCGGQIVNGRCVECGLDNNKNDRKYRLNIHNDSGIHFHEGDCEDQPNRKNVHTGSSNKKNTTAKPAATASAAPVKPSASAPKPKKKKGKGLLILYVIFVLIGIVSSEIDEALPEIERFVRDNIPELSNLLEEFSDGNTGTSQGMFISDHTTREEDEISQQDMVEPIWYDPADECYYSAELDNGIYEVGYDIPEGTYQICCRTMEDVFSFGAVYRYYNDDLTDAWGMGNSVAIDTIAEYEMADYEVPDSYLKDCSEEMFLMEGDWLYFQGFAPGTLWINGLQDQAGETLKKRSSQNLPMNEIELKEDMTVGSSVLPAGVYDVIIKEDEEYGLANGGIIFRTDEAEESRASRLLMDMGNIFLNDSDCYRRITIPERTDLSLVDGTIGHVFLVPSY